MSNLSKGIRFERSADDIELLGIYLSTLTKQNIEYKIIPLPGAVEVIITGF